MDLSPLYDPDADKFLRLQICDWLEEQGDPRAMPWRWIIQEKKRPRSCNNIAEMPSGELEIRITYDWWQHDRYGGHSNVGVVLYSLDETDVFHVCSSGASWREYLSVQAAYNALVDALVRLDAEGKSPWKREREKS